MSLFVKLCCFPLLVDCMHIEIDIYDGSGQALWTCTGRNKTLPPSASLPVTGEIADVNTASLGRYIYGSIKRARWASTMNSAATCATWRGMGSVVLYFARDSPCDENKLLNPAKHKHNSTKLKQSADGRETLLLHCST